MSVELVTLGCRLNTAESETMREQAKAAGLDDVVIVNTCAVTAEAVRQARQTIRRTRRERPNARIVVTGCAAQVEPEKFAEMAEVDLVIGNDAKLQPASWASLADFGIGASEKVRVNDIFSVTETAGHMVAGFEERTRAFVQVQNGCDHRCTFCIIPYGRGNSRSVPAGAVVEQVKRLADRGYREVVLTGVDITSWGGDLPGSPKLGSLVGSLLRKVDGLERLRISSIDSVEADAELIELMAGEARLMPHLHLSLQSGDDMILKRMKRRHSRADSLAFCADLRARRPDIVFGADLIAGFPTETDAMFENTVRLIEDCGLTFTHVFPFSARPGTPAAKMPRLDQGLVKARAARLRAVGEAARLAHLDRRVGRIERVLIEQDDFGHTEQFVPIRVAGNGVSNLPPGDIVTARVVARDGETLRAEALSDVPGRQPQPM